MNSFVSDILNAPLDPNLGLHLALLLGGIWALAAWLLLRPLSVQRLRLKRKVDLLKRHTPPSPAAEKTVEQVSKDFVSDWKAAATDFDGHQVSPVHVSNYVGEAKAYKWWPDSRLNLVRPMSGILLGGGILFTFLGITFGLRGIDTAEADRLLDGVQELLLGMNVAFITSLAGIFLAIVWILLQSGIRGRLEQVLDEWCTEVHRHFPWAPPEELQLRTSLAKATERNQLLQRQVGFAEKQAGLLQTLGVDIAEAVTGRFKKSMEETLVPVIEKLHEELHTFATKQSSMQQSALDGMLTEFREGLFESLEGHAGQISMSLEKSAAQIERFHSTLDSTLEQLDELSRTQTELLGSSTQAAREFKEGIEGLTDVHARITESAAFHREAASVLGELIEGVRGEAEVLTNANAELREQLAGHLDQVSDQVEKLSEATRTFQEATDAMVPRLEAAVTEFSGMAADKLVEVFRVFDREMATVTEHLGSTLHSMQVTIEELSPSTDRLKSAVGDLVEPMTTSQVVLQRLSNDLTASQSVLQRLANDLNASQEVMKELVIALQATNGRGPGTEDRKADGESPPKRPPGPQDGDGLQPPNEAV